MQFKLPIQKVSKAISTPLIIYGPFSCVHCKRLVVYSLLFSVLIRENIQGGSPDKMEITLNNAKSGIQVSKCSLKEKFAKRKLSNPLNNNNNFNNNFIIYAAQKFRYDPRRFTLIIRKYSARHKETEL